MGRHSTFTSIAISIVLKLIPLQGNSQQHQTQLDSLQAVLGNKTAFNTVEKVLLMERITRLYKQRDLAKSEELAKQTLDLAKQTGSPEALSTAYRLISDISSIQGDYAMGADYADKAIKAFDNLSDSLSLAERYEVLMMEGGWLMSKSTYPRRIEYGNKSIELFKKLGNMEGVAKATFDIASLHKNLGIDAAAVNPKDGIQEFNKSLILFKQVEFLYRNLNNKAEFAAAIHAQATAQKALGNLALAYELNNKSLAIFNKEECFLGAGLCLSQIAEIFQAKGQFDSALVNINRAIKLCEQVGFTAGLYDLYSTKTGIYEGLHDYRNALGSNKRAKVEGDKRFAIEQTKRTEGIQKTYEIQLREEKIRTLSAEKLLQSTNLDRQQRTIVLISTGAGTLLVMTYIILYNRSRYQRRIKAIEVRNKVKEEKERISQDLHDNIGSQLTSVSLGLNKLFKEHQLDPVQVGHLNATLNSTMGDLKDTIWAISKMEVTMEELMDKINNLFWRIRQSDSRRFTLQISNEYVNERLKPSQAINTFRIIQESIHNSIKHSQAREINVSVISEGIGKLEVIISDDGVGFDPETQITAGHYGLANMKKRAAEIQGTLTVVATPGQSTVIRLRFSLDGGDERLQQTDVAHNTSLVSG